MAEERKVQFEREYIIPLRKQWLKVPEYKRANKAAKAIREFLVRHMKIYDRDIKKIKIDVLLNNELRFRGMKYPPAKIKVKAIKYDDGTVSAKLVNIPKHIEFMLARKAKKQIERIEKAPKEEVEEKKDEGEKVKEESSKESTELMEKAIAKEEKHTSKTEQQTPRIQRKALKK